MINMATYEILFTGGREASVLAKIVPSNYYASIPGEVLLQIDGPVSPQTLTGILAWYRDCIKGDDSISEPIQDR